MKISSCFMATSLLMEVTLFTSWSRPSTWKISLTDTSLTTCHMVVYSVPWRNTMEVLWEKTTCSQQDSFVPLI